jgi:hypothetical protein
MIRVLGVSDHRQNLNSTGFREDERIVRLTIFGRGTRISVGTAGQTWLDPVTVVIIVAGRLPYFSGC